MSNDPQEQEQSSASSWNVEDAPLTREHLVARHSAIRRFIVERCTNRFYTPKIEGKLDLRASITGEIMLDGALIPEDNLLSNVEGSELSAFRFSGLRREPL
jgi:alkylation response protein AidB-like acyl-CoA dehydrogenase